MQCFDKNYTRNFPIDEIRYAQCWRIHGALRVKFPDSAHKLRNNSAGRCG